MKRLISATVVCLLASALPAIAAGKSKQAQPGREPDLCVVPPGAQPLLPAALLPGMGVTKTFPVTTKSEQARQFWVMSPSSAQY